MPDITRLFRGPRNEFEVEVVFAGPEDTSPREAHPYEEYVFLAEGKILLSRDDRDETELVEGPAFFHIPAGVNHVFDIQVEPTQLVVMHPKRNDGGV